MKRSQLLLGTALAGTVLFAAQPADAQFYARLDAGFAWARDANFQDDPREMNAGNTIFVEEESSKQGNIDEIGSAWLIDGGVGYRFNPWLRTDLTVGYRGDYELDDVSEDVDNISCVGVWAAEITSIPVLINAYVDLGGVIGNIGGIVPYVGAGVGFARNEIDSLTTTVDTSSVFDFNGGSNVDLAWAVMAGFSAPLPGVRNLFLDVGYRYLDSGEITTEGGAVVTSSGVYTSAHQGFVGELRAHEFKAGLRLMLP